MNIPGDDSLITGCSLPQTMLQEQGAPVTGTAALSFRYDVATSADDSSNSSNASSSCNDLVGSYCLDGLTSSHGYKLAGIIAGSVVGGVMAVQLFVTLIVVLVLYIRRRHNGSYVHPSTNDFPSNF